MNATYIPSAGTYGEGVGIPGLISSDPMTTPHSWYDLNAKPSADTVTSRDHYSRTRMPSSASTSTISSVPMELAAQWPLDTVLIWLAQNQFSKDWQETFRSLNLCGAQFLELGSLHGGRGNFGMMHQKVYPRLALECSNSGTGFDQSRERDEGKRMRRLIRSIVTGKPIDPSKMVSSHNRANSVTALSGNNGLENGESPKVSCTTLKPFVILRLITGGAISSDPPCSQQVFLGVGAREGFHRLGPQPCPCWANTR